MLRFESRRSLQETEPASNKMPCKSAKGLLAAYRPVPVSAGALQSLCLCLQHTQAAFLVHVHLIPHYLPNHDNFKRTLNKRDCPWLT